MPLLKTRNQAGNMIDRLINFADVKASRHNDRIDCISYGFDPQCELEIKNPLKRGWYEFRYKASFDKGEGINPKLYIDAGTGYNESSSIAIDTDDQNIFSKFIFFDKPVKKLRLDPTEDKNAVFSIYHFSIEKISFYDILELIGKHNSRYKGTNPIRRKISSLGIYFKNDTIRIQRLLSGLPDSPESFNYQEWIKKYDTFSIKDLARINARQSEFTYRPLISIILPTYNTPVQWLIECITSVLAQIYPNWELCIADDGSTDEEVRKTIEKFSSQDARIKYVFNDKNRKIAAASNEALSLSTGEFVVFLDHDDILHSHALYRIVELLNIEPDTDFIYSDEDKINEREQRVSPFFKPNWSPALLYIQNYLGHLSCVRKTIVADIGGFSEEANGSQDYDLFLKVCARTSKIKHLPYVLYHWRLHAQSTSYNPNSKQYAHASGKIALENFLKRRYPNHFNKLEETGKNFVYKPRFVFDEKNKVSIIIPTKDKIEYLKPCIESILLKSTHKNFEIIILNNNSTEERTFSYFKKVQQDDKRIRVFDAPFEFNWSKLNNFGVSKASGDYLIFLNNDISIITSDWIEQLCEWASLPDVATVGPTLLYEDKTIQHAGVVVGMNGWADHVFKNEVQGYFSSLFVSNNIPRNVLANTGACTVIEKNKFESLGNFDEEFIICGSDVELGIRAHKHGLYNVLNAYVALFHFESKSRGTFVPDNDFVQSALKYEPFRTIQCDPYYNPNLSLNHTSPFCKP